MCVVGVASRSRTVGVIVSYLASVVTASTDVGLVAHSTTPGMGVVLCVKLASFVAFVGVPCLYVVRRLAAPHSDPRA